MCASKPDFRAVIAAKKDRPDSEVLEHRQRGDLIIAACQAAAAIEWAKQKSGLPPSKPAEWPKSTWRFLKEWARPELREPKKIAPD